MLRVLVTGGSGFIGTNLIEQLRTEYEIINIDIKKPLKDEHAIYWQYCDILDSKNLQKYFKEFQPDQVIHLAARTDTEGERTIDDYIVNTEGTKNILDAVRITKSIKRIIITSSQFVHQHHGIPKDDQEFAPHTVYGESKALSERYTRDEKLDCVWTIIRPTNVWGPWHPRYPREFWYTLKKGRYLHPGKTPVTRSYAYVGNVIDQIIKILKAPREIVHEKVFYVGDQPLNLYDWVNEFSKQLNGRDVFIAPRICVKIIAIVGDVLSRVGIGFPLTSSRYKSMVVSNIAPMQKTFDSLGYPQYSLHAGVAVTVKWLREQDPIFWGK